MTIPTDGDAGSDKNPPEGKLRAHLGVKSRQIHEGLIPLRLRRSWLSVNGDFPIYMDIRNLESSTTQKTWVSTFQKLHSLNPSIQKTLEAHVTRLWVRHKWALPIKMLRVITIFKVKKDPSLSLPPFACPPLAIGVSHGDSTEDDTVLEKAPQACLREEVTVNQSVPTRGRFVSTPVRKETERALTGIPHGEAQGTLKLPEAGEGSRWASQKLTSCLTSTTCESRTILGASRGGLETPAVPGTCVVQDGGQPGLQADIRSELQHRVEVKSVSQSHVCTQAVQVPDSSTDVLHGTDNLVCMASQGHLHSTSLGDMLASQMVYDLMADTERSPGQQNSKILEHQHSKKRESKMSALTDKGDTSRRLAPEKFKYLETSMPTQDHGMEDTRKWKCCQVLPQKKPVSSEGTFQGSVRTFLPWISTLKNIKGQDKPQRSSKPASSPAQRPAKSSPRVDCKIAEVQQLMQDARRKPGGNKLVKCERCALELNKHKEEEDQASIKPQGLRFPAAIILVDTQSTTEGWDVQPLTNATAVLSGKSTPVT
ncbi:Protein FAM75A1 [Fukomys damarensis]|uniref:Protein FAM75A1 n=2 Tax=Fukomys damarensis TaxID=885580 RepID=A0A091E2N6_FUKDA|nr:Protein FAM75A1 [Fukomys damarensis]